MTRLDNGIVATDLEDDVDNLSLSNQGYTIRCIETYHCDVETTFIIWDPPQITEADLPY